MTRTGHSVVLAAMLLAISACGQNGGEAGGNGAAGGEAKDAAASGNIASGLQSNARFAAALKAAGLDKTLGGPDQYTVLAPSDAAFDKLPAGAYDGWMKPEARAQLTGVLTYHILPGTVLAEDIGKAIDNAKGKAVLATMGGGTLTATREGDRIVLTDGKGGKATLTEVDQKYSNGVVHSVDSVLFPAENEG